jgi:hypothetical protein
MSRVEVSVRGSAASGGGSPRRPGACRRDTSPVAPQRYSVPPDLGTPDEVRRGKSAAFSPYVHGVATLASTRRHGAIATPGVTPIRQKSVADLTIDPPSIRNSLILNYK